MDSKQKLKEELLTAVKQRRPDVVRELLANNQTRLEAQITSKRINRLSASDLLVSIGRFLNSK